MPRVILNMKQLNENLTRLVDNKDGIAILPELDLMKINAAQLKFVKHLRVSGQCRNYIRKK
jgi:hypothetical protein